MAEHYRFFDSIDGEDERSYTADEFADYFRQFIKNGIFNGCGDNLQVSAKGQDMRTFIKPGYAFIEGYLYKIDIEPLYLQHIVADPVFNRIDRVVIRLDKTLENRYVKAFVRKGTAAETPEVPMLTCDENTHELALAQVTVLAGKSFIEAHQITDERLDPAVCGVATHLFDQVDTTELFNEWQLYLKDKKEQGDNELAAWRDFLADKRLDTNTKYTRFLTLLQNKLMLYQNTWNDWMDEKLIAPDGEFYAQWNDWFEEIQKITNLVPRSQFKSHRDSTMQKGAHGLRFFAGGLEVKINEGKWRRLQAPINTWGGM